MNGNKQVGPFNEVEFQGFINAELLRSDSKVRREDSTDWTTLEKAGLIKPENRPVSRVHRAAAPLSVDCSCGRRFVVSPVFVGQTVVCSKCHSTVYIQESEGGKRSTDPMRKTSDTPNQANRKITFPHYIWLALMILLCVVSPLSKDGELVGLWIDAGKDMMKFPGTPGYFWLASLICPLFAYYLLPKGPQLTFFRFALWRLYSSVMLSPVYWLAQHEVLHGLYKWEWKQTLTTSSHVWFGWGFLALLAWSVSKGFRIVKKALQKALRGRS